MSHWNPVQIINLIEKYKTHAFNTASTVMTVAMVFFLLFLLFLGSGRVIFFKIITKMVKVDYLSSPDSFFFIPK